MLQMRRFNMGAVGEADCPVFDGLFDYCAVSLTAVCVSAVQCAQACEAGMLPALRWFMGTSAVAQAKMI